MRIAGHLGLGIAALLSLAGSASAGPVEDGKAALAAKDYKAALTRFEDAASRGLAEGLYLLGRMYFHGHAVRQDYAEAVQWYRLAVKRGHAPALVDLGLVYDRGLLGTRDAAEAAKWFEKAAAKSIFAAMRRLAEMYRTGDGVPKDPVRGYMWAHIVASDKLAGIQHRDLADRHAADMTPGQVEEGRRMAKKWRDDLRAAGDKQ